jgi:hypothetical protein
MADPTGGRYSTRILAGVGHLEDRIDEVVKAWEGPLVETSVFGTSEPGQIAELIEDFCRTVMSRPIHDCSFYGSSVGCVAGVELSDGQMIVIKAYQPRWTAEFLTAVTRAQRHLCDRGFPCARPVSGPHPLGEGFALVEQLLPDPGNQRLGSGEMRASARGLAEVVALCGDVEPRGLTPHPLDRSTDELYPVPHHPAFDFHATSEGAGWIDNLARHAVARRDVADSPSVIAHSDWSARNVRLRTHGVVAAYDWDSLAFMAETSAVGQAAATWSSRDADAPALAPGVEEVAAYVKAYEEGRGRPFTDAEVDRIGAAALWVLAYTARCEHALGPYETGPRAARARLRVEGDALLHLADESRKGLP